MGNRGSEYPVNVSELEHLPPSTLNIVTRHSDATNATLVFSLLFIILYRNILSDLKIELGTRFVRKATLLCNFLVTLRLNLTKILGHFVLYCDAAESRRFHARVSQRD